MKRESGARGLSKWANRFIVAAIVQGGLAAGLTAYLLYQGIFGVPAASRIVAGGGAGSWLTVGYFGYLTIGLLATGVTALFYRHIEADMGKPYQGWTNFLAWGHLILMSVGVVGATWLMMHAGYRGGAAGLSTAVGGGGLTPAEIHEQIMGAYPPYIAVFMAIALVGILLGGLGYIIAWLRPTEEMAGAAAPSAD
jgi:hypothetical protein